jgi:hypothetical protein
MVGEGLLRTVLREREQATIAGPAVGGEFADAAQQPTDLELVGQIDELVAGADPERAARLHERLPNRSLYASVVQLEAAVGQQYEPCRGIECALLGQRLDRVELPGTPSSGSAARLSPSCRAA